MKRLLLSLLLLLCGHTIWAQTRDWSTIRENDTPYFAGGFFAAGYSVFGPSSGGTISGRLVRRIYVDSIYQGTSERKLFFPKTLRTFDSSVRMWPPGHFARFFSGWQGPFCLQKADSIDEFYNFRGDTIRIFIKAPLGYSWVLARDSSGAEMRATITTTGIQPFDGIPDSFREATLQAYQNQVPVVHTYDQQKIRWTKSKGWMKPLDWFAFPYGNSGLRNFNSFGRNNLTQEDTGSYDRLSDTVSLPSGYTIADLQRRYQPGNAWRIYFERGNYGRKELYRYNYDSVISVTIVGNKCIAQIESVSCTFTFVPPSGPSNPRGYWHTTVQPAFLHTDTIMADTAVLPKTKWLKPEEPNYNGFLNSWEDYLLTDTLCGKPVITRDLKGSFNRNPTLGVCTASIGNSGIYTTTFCPSIVPLRTLSEEAFSELHVIYNLTRLDYFKTASCSFGSYINVPALSVQDISTTMAWSIAPNPAADAVTITTPTNVQGTLSLTDLTGKVLLPQPFSGNKATLAVRDFPAGLYLIRLSGKDFAQTQKLIITR